MDAGANGLPPPGLIGPGPQDYDDYGGGEDRRDQSESGSQIGDSVSVAGGGGNYSQGKRLKKLQKLVAGPKALSALTKLRRHMWVVVAALLAVHIATFAVLTVSLEAQKGNTSVSSIYATNRRRTCQPGRRVQQRIQS